MSEIVTFGSGSGAEASAKGVGSPSIFQRGASLGLAMKMPNRSPEVLQALQQVNQLTHDYESLKADVFLRADRASWAFLSSVYDFVLSINQSASKRQIKNDLLELIKQRDRLGMSTSAGIETIVARYIFADMARQSRNNYIVVMQKALAMDVKKGELFALLYQYGGISNWINNGFNGAALNDMTEKDQRKLKRTDSVNLMRRLLTVLAATQEGAEVKTSQVVNWAPTETQVVNLPADKKELPKNQPADFVFFIAKPNEEEGQYTLIQGFNAARDFEDQFLQQIVTRLGASNEQLQTFISEFEASAKA